MLDVPLIYAVLMALFLTDGLYISNNYFLDQGVNYEYVYSLT
jgi:hypothetical protein